MSHATTIFNVDENGYLLVTNAADCRLRAVAKIVSDATKPTPIPQEAGVAKPLIGRRRIHLRNWDLSVTKNVWIGGADVTTAKGYPIPPLEEVVLEITDAIQLYAIVQTDKEVDLRSLELA